MAFIFVSQNTGEISILLLPEVSDQNVYMFQHLDVYTKLRY